MAEIQVQQKNIPKLRFSGFKKSWKKIQLKNITIKIGSGKTPKGGRKVYENSGIPFLRSQNIMEGKLDLKDLVFINKETDEDMKNSRTYYGDILLNITGASIGRSSVNTYKENHANVNQHVCIIRIDGTVNAKMNNQLLISPKGKNIIFRTQSGGSREGLNFKDIGNMNFYLPEKIQEQQKIGNFFTKLDQQIELEEKKLVLLEEQKKGYMQKIFSQELCFKDKNGKNYPKWVERNIKDVLGERQERSDVGQLLSVTINYGIIKFDEVERKDNSSKNKSNYKKVYVGDIVYNSMRMWQGASGKSEYDGIVSPAYTILYPKLDLDADFIAYYFKTHKIIHIFKRYSQGLTSDTWNLKYKQLQEIKLNIPAYEEQKKISSFFRKLDERIGLQSQKVESLKTQKQGFLQKMFV